MDMEKHVFKAFAAGLKVLVQEALRWQKAANHRRLVWMTCGYQWADSTSYYWLSANPVVVQALNRMAFEAMTRNGFDFVDVTSANIAAVYRRQSFGIGTDIHHYEHSCPSPGSDFWLGGDVHLAKMEVQRVFQQVCAPTKR